MERSEYECRFHIIPTPPILNKEDGRKTLSKVHDNFYELAKETLPPIKREKEELRRIKKCLPPEHTQETLKSSFRNSQIQ